MRSAMKALCAASIVLGAIFAAPHSAAAQGMSHKSARHQVKQHQMSQQEGMRYSRTRNLLCDDGTWMTKAIGCANHGGVAARQVTPRASEQAILHANEHSAVARAYANTTARRAIARCKDGTYWHASTRADACVDHGGVRRWL